MPTQSLFLPITVPFEISVPAQSFHYDVVPQ